VNSNGMRHGALRTAVAMVAALGALALVPAGASAAAGLSAITQFALPTVTVGNANLAGTLTFSNSNSAPDGNATICRSDDTAPLLTQCVGAEGIVLTASCGNQFPNGICRPAAGEDPDVFFVHPSAVGSAGVCNGVAFTATRVPGSPFGKYRFDPPTGTHVVLPANGDSCTISFTFDVLRAPNIDIRPLLPELQTAQVIEVTEQSSVGNIGAGQGTSTPTTVLLATPAITTNASADVVLGAGSLSDQATVSGLVSPGATGTVTFRLYGPNDTSCAGAPVFTNSQSLVLNAASTGGTAQSATFTPTAAGVYRWIASYSGDANNMPISGTCGIATETRTVTPPPVTPPPPPPPPPPPTIPCTPPPGTPPPGGTVCKVPPTVCTTPPGPAPTGGTLCARGTAAIRGTTGCAGTPFNVLVTGKQIQSVVFTLDSKTIRTLTKPNSGTRYKLPVNPRVLPAGVHRVLARTTFRKQSGTKARTLRVTFSRCARKAVSPAFTG
jgi:hypothetical protein